jgi:hypothetical protein
MNSKKILTIFATILFHSLWANSQSIHSKDSTTKVAPSRACEICLLESKIQDCEFGRAAGYANRENQKYFDSIATVKGNLEVQFLSLVKEFKTEQNFISDEIAIDSARNSCINSYVFGAELTKSRRDSLYIFLHDEMLNGKSGYSISSKAAIEKRKPQYNTSGQIIIYERDSNNVRKEVVIDDWELWKKEQIAKWDLWMNEMNVYLMELYGKKWEEFSEIEQVVFEYQLKRFRYGTK